MVPESYFVDGVILVMTLFAFVLAGTTIYSRDRK